MTHELFSDSVPRPVACSVFISGMSLAQRPRTAWASAGLYPRLA